MTVDRRRDAEALAYALGIALYLDGDVIRQLPPGERIEPGRDACPRPETHGMTPVRAD